MYSYHAVGMIKTQLHESLRSRRISRQEEKPPILGSHHVEGMSSHSGSLLTASLCVAERMAIPWPARRVSSGVCCETRVACHRPHTIIARHRRYRASAGASTNLRCRGVFLSTNRSNASSSPALTGDYPEDNTEPASPKEIRDWRTCIHLSDRSQSVRQDWARRKC